MTALNELRQLLNAGNVPSTTSGVVQAVGQMGRVSVASGGRVISCTTAIPVRPGEHVRLQGLVIVSRQLKTPGELPEYRV